MPDRQGSLFPDRPPMSRRTDPDTSHAASARVEPHLSELQGRVLGAFQARGSMTAREAELLEVFLDCRPSTVRKRISELALLGLLRTTGTVRDGCAEYRLAARAGGPP